MTDHNSGTSDDRFLDELYAQTKNESSPPSIDNKILIEAKAHTEQRYSAVFKWQRLASVAAVMVFSIYIFFGVQEQQDRSLESDMYSPQPRLQMSPETDFQADLEEKVLEESSIQESLPAMEIAPTLSSPESAILKEARKSEARNSIPALKRESNFKKKAIVEQNDVMADRQGQQLQQHSRHSKTPKELVMEIRLMIARIKPQRAKVLYDILKTQYEDFEVPEDIEIYMLALDKRNNKDQ